MGWKRRHQEGGRRRHHHPMMMMMMIAAQIMIGGVRFILLECPVDVNQPRRLCILLWRLLQLQGPSVLLEPIRAICLGTDGLTDPTAE
jgi:hypothetical protein